MLTEYVHKQTQIVDRELRALAQSRPRYERPEARSRSRIREFLRALALRPVKATPRREGGLPDVRIRPADATDLGQLVRLAEASERRVPSGPVLVAEVDSTVIAALPLDGAYVMTDLLRPTGDVVQLLELRSEQLRAARLDEVA